MLNPSTLVIDPPVPRFGTGVDLTCNWAGGFCPLSTPGAAAPRCQQSNPSARRQCLSLVEVVASSRCRQLGVRQQRSSPFSRAEAPSLEVCSLRAPRRSKPRATGPPASVPPKGNATGHRPCVLTSAHLSHVETVHFNNGIPINVFSLKELRRSPPNQVHS